MRSFVLALMLVVISSSVFGYSAGKLYRSTRPGDLKGVLVIIDPGHGGNDPGGAHWKKYGKDFWEAAYTYRIAAEFGAKVQARGGSVIYTAVSVVMWKNTLPSVAIPRPYDATFPDGTAVSYAGLLKRSDVANKAWDDYGKKYKYAFVSIHIDSMGKTGWSGMHVCYDSGEAPTLAKLIFQNIMEYNYARRVSDEIRHPLDYRHNLGILKRKNNKLAQRVIVELGIPVDKDDSWRLRYRANREQAIDRVLVKPLVAWAKGVKPLDIVLARPKHRTRVAIISATVEKPEPEKPRSRFWLWTVVFWILRWWCLGIIPGFCALKLFWNYLTPEGQESVWLVVLWPLVIIRFAGRIIGFGLRVLKQIT